MELPFLSASPTSLADRWQHFSAIFLENLCFWGCPPAKRHPAAAADAVVHPSRQMVVSTGLDPLSMGLDAALHLPIPVSTLADRFRPSRHAGSMSACKAASVVIIVVLDSPPGRSTAPASAGPHNLTTPNNIDEDEHGQAVWEGDEECLPSPRWQGHGEGKSDMK